MNGGRDGPQGRTCAVVITGDDYGRGRKLPDDVIVLSHGPKLLACNSV